MEEKSISIYKNISEVEEKCKFYMSQNEYKNIIKKVKTSDEVAPLLSEIYQNSYTLKNKILDIIRHPFYQNDEYKSKDIYLSYLKMIYDFHITTFDNSKPENKKIIEDLLTEFYLEVKLIEPISDEKWDEIKKSKNPEFEISKEIYDIKFDPQFKKFLEKIPWRISRDVYKAPLFDGAHFHRAGTELPKRKPSRANEKFLAQLIKEESYKEIILDENNFIELKNITQLIEEIDKNGQAKINLYQGISKYEGDFLIQQQIRIFPNPKQGDKLLSRIFEGQKPYLYTITERILPLDISFLESR